MSELYILALLLVLCPIQISTHQQATFGDVVGGGGGGGSPAPPIVEAENPLNDAHAAADGSRTFQQHARDKDHIIADMEGVLNKPESEMSQEELQFHYFKLHDSNNDNLLDGWELMFALNHDHKDANEKKSMSDQEISDLLDPIFREDDKDQDGFISYAEFMASIK